MTLRKIDLPRTIVMGNDVLSQIPSIVKDLDFEGPVLIFADTNTWQLAGSFVQEQLEDSGYEVTSFDVKGATIDQVTQAKELILETNADTILGVGGGTVIDVAKLSSFETHRSFISVPTVASHDGIASPRASIHGKNAKHSLAARSPIAVVADLNIINNAPHRFTAAGSGDVIAKYTSILDWKLAHRIKGERLSEQAIALANISVNHVVEKRELIGRHELVGTEAVIKSLISSSMAMCIAGSSRPASGSEHLFSHALDLVAKKPALHGEQVGVGTILMAYLHGIDWRHVKETLAIIGAPTTAKELGVTDEEVLQALMKAHTVRPERYTILGSDGLTEEAAYNAASITGVIEG